MDRLSKKQCFILLHKVLYVPLPVVQSSSQRQSDTGLPLSKVGPVEATDALLPVLPPVATVMVVVGHFADGDVVFVRDEDRAVAF